MFTPVLTPSRYLTVVLAVFASAAFGIAVATPKAEASEHTESYSLSLTGAKAWGNVRWQSEDTSKYTIVHSVKDTQADGLCARLERSSSNSLYLDWKTVADSCGNGHTHGPFGTGYDQLGHVGAIKLRVCLVQNGRNTRCGSAKRMLNPYLLTESKSDPDPVDKPPVDTPPPVVQPPPPVNQAPIANDQRITVYRNQWANGTQLDARDPELGGLTYRLVSQSFAQANFPTFAFGQPFAIKIPATATVGGVLHFTYEVTDSGGLKDTAQVTMDIR